MTDHSSCIWDNITAEQYAAKGSFTVKGTLERSREEVLLTVNVTDPVITSVNTISVTTRKKVAPVLPATVLVGYSDGSVKNLNVKWDEIDKKQYEKEGSFVVYGGVDGTTIKAAANVIVTNKKPDNK